MFYVHLYEFLCIWSAGDGPPHALWDETQVRQLNMTSWIAKQFTERLPGVSVYPTLGNHGRKRKQYNMNEPVLWEFMSFFSNRVKFFIFDVEQYIDVVFYILDGFPANLYYIPREDTQVLDT